MELFFHKIGVNSREGKVFINSVLCLVGSIPIKVVVLWRFINDDLFFFIGMFFDV